MKFLSRERNKKPKQPDTAEYGGLDLETVEELEKIVKDMEGAEEKTCQPSEKRNIKKEQRTAEKERRNKEKAEKRAALAEAKTLEKARIADLKKDREELYIIRKNTVLKIVRFFLWSMLFFIFLKGVIVSVRPDPTAEVNNTIAIFKSEFSGYQEQDNEILAFAQNFAVQYLTYESSNEQNYVDRIKEYCTDTISNAGYKFPSGTSATVIYANAYRKEEYSSLQTDVWVLLNVQYTSKETNGEGIVTEVKTLESTILKVPVSMKANHYIIEDLPAYVNDNIKLSGYEQTPYKGKECNSDVTENIKIALTNFYKAYYEQPQEVINYFLSPSADPGQFMGLNSRVSFNRIESIRAYYKNENNTTDFIVILTLSVTDKNGIKMNQNFNLDVILKDNQYYIVGMNTRNTNIKMEVN